MLRYAAFAFITLLLSLHMAFYAYFFAASIRQMSIFDIFFDYFTSFRLRHMLLSPLAFFALSHYVIDAFAASFLSVLLYFALLAYAISLIRCFQYSQLIIDVTLPVSLFMAYCIFFAAFFRFHLFSATMLPACRCCYAFRHVFSLRHC